MVYRQPIVALIASAILAACRPVPAPAPEVDGDPGRGRQAMQAFECHACHVIPGIRGPAGRVGPSLAGYGRNVFIAGRFPQDPATLAAWIRDAPALSPSTAMPAFPMADREARDMAAYLYSLR